MQHTDSRSAAQKNVRRRPEKEQDLAEQRVGSRTDSTMLLALAGTLHSANQGRRANSRHRPAETASTDWTARCAPFRVLRPRPTAPSPAVQQHRAAKDRVGGSASVASTSIRVDVSKMSGRFTDQQHTSEQRVARRRFLNKRQQSRPHEQRGRNQEQTAMKVRGNDTKKWQNSINERYRRRTDCTGFLKRQLERPAVRNNEDTNGCNEVSPAEDTTSRDA
jgi:hypothetical protein